MKIRKPNEKLVMNTPPKSKIEVLEEKVELVDKKLDQIIKAIRSIKMSTKKSD